MRDKKTIDACVIEVTKRILLLLKKIKFRRAFFYACEGLLKYEDLAQVDFDELAFNIVDRLIKRNGKKYSYKSIEKIMADARKMSAISKAIMERTSCMNINMAELGAILYMTKHKKEPWLFENDELCALYILREVAKNLGRPIENVINK